MFLLEILPIGYKGDSKKTGEIFPVEFKDKFKQITELEKSLQNILLHQEMSPSQNGTSEQKDNSERYVLINAINRAKDNFVNDLLSSTDKVSFGDIKKELATREKDTFKQLVKERKESEKLQKTLGNISQGSKSIVSNKSGSKAKSVDRGVEKMYNLKELIRTTMNEQMFLAQVASLDPAKANVKSGNKGAINGDKKVTQMDQIMILDALGGNLKLKKKEVKSADLNKDKKLDFKDYFLLLEKLQQNNT